MSIIKPDLSEIQAEVGAGTYTVRVVDAVIGEWASKTGGAPTTYVNWSLETFGEPESRNNGRRIFHRTPINGKGAFRLAQFYKAAMKQELKGEFDTQMLFGKALSVSVVDGTDKEGNATGYTEVKAVKPV